jgi:Flp pilus assembly protein TadD
MDGARADADARFDEGYRHLEAGAFGPAQACFRAAIALDPAFLEAHVNLAWALEQDGVLGQAEAGYRRALELDPHSLGAHRNLGVLLVRQKRFEEAEAVYRRVLGIHPRSASLWTNLGVLLADLKREAEAEACFRSALELDPDFQGAHYNLGYLFLRRGQFEAGWRGREARSGSAFAARFQFPRWEGEDLAGLALLIAVQAGHGDMIQFCRYAAVLKQRGAARIGVLCHAPLVRLFRSLDGVDQVFGLDGPLPTAGWDFWTQPLSIPLHCGTRLETIPAAIPYVHPEPDLVAAWSARLPADGLRVGLVWKGSAGFESDGDRSLGSLVLLEPLGAVPGVRFISLQKGAGETEADHPPPGLPVVNVGPLMQDFADTAAIMASLDLVITVDTAAAHLAGALGKPCWVLLPDYRTDWRWLTGRADSPWYPGSMRLFRQTASGWPDVIRDVAAALARFQAAQNHCP